MTLPPQDQTGSSIPMAGIGAGAGALIVIVVVVIATVVSIRLMIIMTNSKCLLFSFRIQNFFIYSNSFSVKKSYTLASCSCRLRRKKLNTTSENNLMSVEQGKI